MSELNHYESSTPVPLNVEFTNLFSLPENIVLMTLTPGGQFRGWIGEPFRISQEHVDSSGSNLAFHFDGWEVHGFAHSFAARHAQGWNRQNINGVSVWRRP
jgi:hypothetical protein